MLFHIPAPFLAAAGDDDDDDLNYCLLFPCNDGPQYGAIKPSRIHLLPGLFHLSFLSFFLSFSISHSAGVIIDC